MKTFSKYYIKRVHNTHIFKLNNVQLFIDFTGFLRK